MKSVSVKSLIPSYWDLSVRNKNDIINLGKTNIRSMVQYHKIKVKEGNEYIRAYLRKDIKLIQSGNYISLKSKYKMPDKSDILMKEDDAIIKEVDLLNGNGDITTFNMCGWCEHNGGGSFRYNYMIHGSCSILSNACINIERVTNSLCYFTGDKKKDNEVVTGLKKSLKQTIENIKKRQEYISYLNILLKTAKNHPALSNHRKCDHFNLNDKVVCYIGNWKENEHGHDIIVDDKFVEGVVINGYRHHDGGVSVCYDKKIHNGDYLEGRGGGYGSSRPEVMLKSEFEQFLNDMTFVRIWTKNINDMPNFNRIQFISDLMEYKRGLICQKGK
jgi:hypothetical protein